MLSPGQGPFWFATFRDKRMEEWVEPFRAKDESGARAFLDSLHHLKNKLELRGPFAAWGEARSLFDRWMKAQT